MYFQLHLHEYLRRLQLSSLFFHSLSTENTEHQKLKCLWIVISPRFPRNSTWWGLFRHLNMTWFPLPQALLSPSITDYQNKLVRHRLQEREHQNTCVSGSTLIILIHTWALLTDFLTPYSHQLRMLTVMRNEFLYFTASDLATYYLQDCRFLYSNIPYSKPSLT